MTENNSLPPASPPTRRRRSFFWPFLLIALGVLLLLSNLGLVSWSTWNLIWRFWPLILVAIGVDVLIGSRSPLGAVISALVILALIGAVTGAVYFADRLPALNRFTSEAPWKNSQFEETLGNYESATVFIDWTSLPGYLGALEDSPNLIEGDITYQGELDFEVDRKGSRADVRVDTRSTGGWVSFSGPGPGADWEIYLSPNLPLDLSLDSGSGSCEFDLSELILEELFIDSGSGSIKVILPEDSSYPVTIDSGSGSLRIDIPEDTGIRVRIDSGSGSFNPGRDFTLVSGERNGDGVWESKNYDDAPYTIEMQIDQKSGSITFN